MKSIILCCFWASIYCILPAHTLSQPLDEQTINNIKQIDSLMHDGRVSGVHQFTYYKIVNGQSIKDINIYNTNEIILADFDNKFNIVFTPMQMRYQSITEIQFPLGENYYRDETFAYNGEKIEEYNKYILPANNNLMTSQGAIRNTELYDNYLKYYHPLYNGYYVRNTPISEVLLGNIENDHISNMNVENTLLDGKECIKIEGILINSQETIEIYLSETEMYRPIRIVFLSKERKKIILNTFQKYQDNIFFPIKTEIERRSAIDNLLQSEEVIVYDDIILNTVVSNDEFTINFPKGLKVYNAIFDTVVVY